jgi:Lipocalin-like domain
MRPEHAPQALPLSKLLVGTWLLLSRIDRTRKGERRIEPMLGEDPIAFLYYDSSGNFAAQFMKRNRGADPEPTVAVSSSTTPNNTRAQGGYDAYFGTYAVDDAQGTVTQTLVGALSPGNVGLVLTRAMSVDGDVLTIALETAAADGEPVTRTLVWHRARR